MNNLKIKILKVQVEYMEKLRKKEEAHKIYNSIGEKVLKENVFKTEEGKRIYSDKETFRLSYPNMCLYLKEVNKEFIKFDKDHKWDQTLWSKYDKPLLDVEKEIINISKELLIRNNQCVEWLDNLYNLDDRQRVIDLFMNLDAKTIK